MGPCIPGVSLRTGCFIIGGIEIVIGLVGCIFYTLGLVSVGEYKELTWEEIKIIQGSFVIPFVNSNESGQKGPPDLGSTLLIIFSIALISSLVYAMLGILLLYSSLKTDIKLLKTWIICQSILILTSLIYIIVTLIMGYTSALNLICDFLSTCIQCYFLWVVYSLIVKLSNEQTFTMSPSIRKSGEKIDIMSFPLDAFSKS